MSELTRGLQISIKTREVTAEDTRSGLYYQYFGGLTGKVDREYDDGSVCVEIDLDSLSEEAKQRHLDIQEAERKKWLASLSDEMRSRLTAEQKQLKINYKLLVYKNDLVIA